MLFFKNCIKFDQHIGNMIWYHWHWYCYFYPSIREFQNALFRALPFQQKKTDSFLFRQQCWLHNISGGLVLEKSQFFVQKKMHRNSRFTIINMIMTILKSYERDTLKFLIFWNLKRTRAWLNIDFSASHPSEKKRRW